MAVLIRLPRGGNSDDIAGKLSQVTASRDSVLEGYTGIGSDGELFEGAAKLSADYVSVDSSTWTTTYGSSYINITIPLSPGALYYQACGTIGFYTGASASSTGSVRFAVFYNEATKLAENIMASTTALSATVSINTSTGVLTVAISSTGTIYTGAKPSISNAAAHYIGG